MCPTFILGIIPLSTWPAANGPVWPNARRDKVTTKVLQKNANAAWILAENATWIFPSFVGTGVPNTPSPGSSWRPIKITKSDEQMKTIV